jgi:serine/threonine-protein kinase HipA
MGEFYVYNSNAFAGKCFWTERRGRVSSLFSYDSDYLARDGWNIDPSLLFVEGSQAAEGELPGALRDAAPDRWGRSLIWHRSIREYASNTGRPRTLNEIDYLLGVSDLSRQGSLRFALKKGEIFQHPSDDIPKLISLPALLDATDAYTRDEGGAEAISRLLDAGSASLGGARPKASVLDGDKLYIAKFPHRQDEIDVIAWEWVALELAAAAGITTPPRRLIDIDGRNVLLVERFDRKGAARVGYISAMTAIGRKDGERGDYSEIADRIRDISSHPSRDTEELLRRIIFSLAINNTDDHLKNHGFIADGSAWRLSPVFDVNPDPDTFRARNTAVLGETECNAALRALMSSGALRFGLTQSAIERIISDVTDAVSSFSKYAATAKIPKGEVARLENVFNRFLDFVS